MTRNFNERFSIKVGLEEAQKKFINRAFNVIFEGVLYRFCNADELSTVRMEIATALGVRYYSHHPLSHYIGDDFLRALRAIEAVYAIGRGTLKENLGEQINSLLSTAEIDLGVRWKNDHFEPAGAGTLDKGLVDENLNWLRQKEYKSVSDPFEKGLRHLLGAIKDPSLLSDVITDMYEALEALAKIITDRQDKDLSANCEALIARIGVSDDYKAVLRPSLKLYIEYANKFRHAAKQGDQKPKPSQRETESFVYLTGLLIRLGLQ